MRETASGKPEDFQEQQYGFPYHWLPHSANNVWRIERNLWWGYRYLALLESTKARVLAKNPRRVLDFGCGDGRLTVELVDAGVPEVVGVDISEAALKFARAFAQNRAVTFTSRLADLSSQTFDVIVAMEVLEHLPPEQTADILEQLWRLLEPAGVLVISTPTWQSRFSAKHYRHFSKAELIETVQPWFAVEKIDYIHKKGIAAALLQKLLINRLFIANWRMWLKGVRWGYEKFVLKADEETGLHLVAVLNRVI